MKVVAPVRKEMGVRTLFNILGPLTNPAGAPNILMGVFHPDLVGIQVRVLQDSGAQRALVVWGRDGMDEISLGAATLVGELRDGVVREYEVHPEDFGIAMAASRNLRVNNAPESKAMLLQALHVSAGCRATSSCSMPARRCTPPAWSSRSGRHRAGAGHDSQWRGACENAGVCSGHAAACQGLNGGVWCRPCRRPQFPVCAAVASAARLPYLTCCHWVLYSGLAMTDILNRILKRKAEEVAERRVQMPLAELIARAANLPDTRGFAAAIEAKIEAGLPAVIAEVKKASPSKGVIRTNFCPAAIARSYAAGGATCLSVLTDQRFFPGQRGVPAGSACGVQAAAAAQGFRHRSVSGLRGAGDWRRLHPVDSSALDDEVLLQLALLAAELDLDVLCEVHNEEEMERAQALPVPLIGVNNRNLRSFETSLETSLQLQQLLEYDRTLVAESGIRTPEDVALLRAGGIQAFLVGEAFMRAEDPGAGTASAVRDSVTPQSSR